MNILIFVIIALSITICIIILELLIQEYKDRRNLRVSIRDSMEQYSFPIFCFNIEGQEVNFILDTGSNVSCIDKQVLTAIPHEILGEKEAITIDGISHLYNKCNLILQYEQYVFPEEFIIKDLHTVFSSLQQDSDITISGIIGNTFLQRHKFLLDFYTMTVSSRGEKRQ